MAALYRACSMNWLVPSGIASLMDELSAAESRGSPAAASIIRASWNSLTGTVNEPVTLSSATPMPFFCKSCCAASLSLSAISGYSVRGGGVDIDMYATTASISTSAMVTYGKAARTTGARRKPVTGFAEAAEAAAFSMGRIAPDEELTMTPAFEPSSSRRRLRTSASTAAMPLHRHVHDFFVRFQDLVPHLDRGLEGHRRSLHRDRHIGERYILTAHIGGLQLAG